ncbi:PIN domain-containing protein [Paenibacillus sp. P32E]|uniref:PIN domain-containing protein n=1 Tax=Paenibacillus sp. P32E TaxID=1349434 RepID=UPI00094031E0|nr:PIN domain-containing protein [Paenibacillus sp. P32E]OKP83731.1 hypothetical protein A3848_25980 [Paenibacillus sp. P32E]
MEKKSCVVFDTNIWVCDTYLLKTPVGISTLYYLNTNKMVIALPEVVELEMKKHYLKLGNEAVKHIEKHFETIEILMGERDKYHLPTNEDLIMAFDKQINLLEHLIIKIPLTLQQARKALMKTIDEIPPNAYKNQQYKDSCIWEAIMDLAKEHKVYFITQDKGFFENREPRNGLARELKREVSGHNFEIYIYESLNIFLNDIKSKTPELNRSNLSEQLYRKILSDYIPENEVLREMKSCELSIFLTEKLNFLSISFILEVKAEFLENESEEAHSGFVKFEGECFYDSFLNQVISVQLSTITYYKEDGTKKTRTVYMSALASYGRDSKKYMIRNLIE